MSTYSVGIVGAGALGSMYATHLARAGVDVAFVAAGARAERLRSDDLTANGEPVDVPVVDPTTGGEHTPFDLVLVAVKAIQLDESLDLLTPVVGEGTTFVSVLNGLESEEHIGEHFRPDQVLLCIALGMDSDREGSAVRWTSPGRLEIGDGPATRTADGSPSERLRAVQDVLDRAGEPGGHRAPDVVEVPRQRRWQPGLGRDRRGLRAAESAGSGP